MPLTITLFYLYLQFHPTPKEINSFHACYRAKDKIHQNCSHVLADKNSLICTDELNQNELISTQSFNKATFIINLANKNKQTIFMVWGGGLAEMGT